MFKILLAAFLLALAAAIVVLAVEASRETRRSRASEEMRQRNYKDAYADFRALALDPESEPNLAASDLKAAIDCLRALGRADEIDDFRDAVVKSHKDHWRVLLAAASTIADGEHYGFIVAGKFHRGQHRGGGRYVGGIERDRVAALQLMTRARALAKDERDREALARFHLEFARILMFEQSGRDAGQGWRLQILTDLNELPDYEEGYRGNGDGRIGAPVDSEGRPVFFRVPKTYEGAKQDGERWRWMLAQAEEVPTVRDEARSTLAAFLRRQFGVQTMAWYGTPAGPKTDDGRDDESGPFAVATLGEDETIARLATGVKRFKLPDEFNFIKIFREIADGRKSDFGSGAFDMLGQIFEDRRQYPKAAEIWKNAIARHGPGHDSYRRKRLDQIVGAWGQFGNENTQPAGKPASVQYRFRNGKKVHFEAYEISTSKLLADTKEHLKRAPDNQRFEWDKVNLANVGFRLVNQNEKKYLGDRVANWDLDLDPRDAHRDRLIAVETPLKKAGAYLVSARMADGNLSRIVLWVADTAIVKKPTPDGTFYFVADAVTGAPIARANLEFFGYKWTPVEPNKGVMRISTANFAEFTDREGKAVLSSKDLKSEYQWIAIARTDAGRLAFVGFSGVWHPNYNTYVDPRPKVFVITDRPVYRPGQPVKFKFWARHARYDDIKEEPTANLPFRVKINSPKGETIFERAFKSDEFGGFDGEYTSPNEATLGVYQIYIDNLGGGSFRVEEYKKPEFEVSVDAPAEPVRLGEKITAAVRAKYYFGAPVAEAKVSYKVMRTRYEQTWFPRGRWDWLYGAGYGWFARDYSWYPGWGSWGWKVARFSWLPTFQNDPPEVVAQDEVAIGPDGTVKIAIDTEPALKSHDDADHRYEITAEVVDSSRRTIVGTGSVLVARKPFQVFVWLDRGYYRSGQDVQASFQAHSLDQKPIRGKGKAALLRIGYEDGKPVEKAVENWAIDTDEEGKARLQIKAADAGQYRLSYTLTDAKGRSVEGGYVFVVRGEGFDGRAFRFNDLELIADKREYAPGETVRLMVNSNRAGGTVVLFVRPANGAALPTKILRLDGKSAVFEIAVAKGDMPNFFVEGLTISDGKIHTELTEVVVPPEKKTLNVEVTPSRPTYKPGAPAKIQVKVTDQAGKPFVGSTVVSLYDKALEYIAGGSNVSDIRAFFWKWRRTHYPQNETNLDFSCANLVTDPRDVMSDLGIFGDVSIWGEGRRAGSREMQRGHGQMRGGMGGMDGYMASERRSNLGEFDKRSESSALGLTKAGAAPMAAGAEAPPPPANPPPMEVQPMVRKAFADAALWAPSLTTDREGLAEVSLNMPENLTAWKLRAWSMGAGTQVGQAESEAVTAKDLLLRIQSPRFFVQYDEVVLSANIHNYLKIDKDVRAVLELDGHVLESLDEPSRKLRVKAGGEERVDWKVRVASEGEAVVRMKALTDEESDAAELRFPALVHGMLKTDSFAGSVRPGAGSSKLTFRVPEARRPGDSRLEVRYSPTLAGALVDALPYLAEYPYGCTEQTLNRFLPTVIASGVLRRMGLDLKTIRDKRTNLNAQEIGDPAQRAGQWKRYPSNPVFDEDEVRRMVREGLKDLTAMQLSDGGWGWFSGYGEHSDAHMTAQVVRGLQTARKNEVALAPGVLEKALDWLKRHQADQVLLLKNAPTKTKPYKERADNLDAFILMVLADSDVLDREMLAFLERDRPHLSVYGLTLLGLALEKLGQKDSLAKVMRNIEQYLVKDAENQSAYLRLPQDCPWWFWYGSEIETQAYYLKLLAKTDPHGETAPALVKYLLNNRKHATYWNSTRDTALCIEAMAEFLKASGEDRPDMVVSIVLDGKPVKSVRINAGNLFSFDNAFLLSGKGVESGEHTIEVRREGRGPVYFNAYVSYFTLENPIRGSGLEVKVGRKIYRVQSETKSDKVAGSRGEVVTQKESRDRREELKELSVLKSGDLVEIELEIESKNDYEYLVFEDMKAAGFEPVEVRSGYNGNDLGAYMELRDQKVCFFTRSLARGRHSVRYRLRAEIPGKFSALPTLGYGMYAPELRANSNEAKVVIED